MKTSIAAALAGLAMASTPTLGADLFGSAPPPMSYPGSQGPLTEVGTNWYLRGDVGYGFEIEPTVVPSAGLIPQILRHAGANLDYVNTPPGDASSKVADARNRRRASRWRRSRCRRPVQAFCPSAARWAHRSGARTSRRHRRRLSRQQLAAARRHLHVLDRPSLSYAKRVCPRSLPRPSRTRATPAGYSLATPAATAPATSIATQPTITVLASAYLDLGDYWGFTPYIGAGAGLNANTISGSTPISQHNDGSRLPRRHLDDGHHARRLGRARRRRLYDHWRRNRNVGLRPAELEPLISARPATDGRRR